MTSTRDALYLWVSRGTPDQPPDRVEVIECPTCWALVPVAHVDKHAQRHRRRVARSG